MTNHRIALVSLHTSPLDAPGRADAGGMNVMLLGLADALIAAGHEVELLTRSRDEGDADARTPGGALVRHLDAGPRASVAKAELPAHLAAFGERMRELPPYDLVYSHYWLSGAAALPVAQEWGVPHVQSLHTVAALKNSSLAPGDTPEPGLRLSTERMLVRASELTVTLSRAERAAVLEAYGAPADRVRVVAPGVDTRLFGVGKKAARPTLVVLARIQPLKGVELAIEAVARVIGRSVIRGGLPSGAPSRVRPRLVVAGGTSPGHEAYADGLRRRVAELGLDDDIEFLPERTREQAAVLLREAALLLIPSHSETFGLVALEAAASGTPVIAGPAGGLAESVADGVSGVIVPERDPEAWAEAIESLLNDPVALERLSSSAAAHGAARGWDATALELGRLTGSLAADPTAGFGDRPVFLHAHPDDESISTGGTLAALIAAGRTPVLLTGTRGEYGEVVPGELHPLEGTPELAPHREHELAAALAELGGVPQHFLGSESARADGRPPRQYSDSGMQWGEDGFAEATAEAGADSLSLAPLEDVVLDVLAGIRNLAPHGVTAVVGYDALGGYGHPDHVRMHHAGVEAARRLGVPYLAIVEPRVEGEAGSAATLAVPLDSEALAAKTRAMAAHRTQLTIAGDPPEFTLSGGQTHPVAGVERYRLLP
ncbi:glycosyltransferase [Herbiconiux liangxiaofengii]|uniref:glycosyltransferase n=1 Tax=Herbiconiux liangxiaofengii TaxID=3342795 RepID=UPI0035B7172D